MKVQTRIFLDLCLFTIFFVVAAMVMYKGVYTEHGPNPSGGLVVISEIRPTGGVGKTNDEFIELYNPQSGPIIIGGWSLSKITKSASSSDGQLLFSFPVGLVLPGHAHVLVAHVDSNVSTTADYLYSGQALSDDNSVVLSDNEGVVMDLVGYGLAKNVETESADAPNSQLLSIERKPGAEMGNAHDTNHNNLDFFRTQSNPQSLRSPLTPLIVEPILVIPTSTENFASSTPVVTSTTTVITMPTSTEVMYSTSTTTLPTSTESIPIVVDSIVTTSPHYVMGSVLITELYPMPRSGESEFVELFNRSPHTIDLTDWYISDGSGAKSILSGSISSLEYRTIEKPKGSLNNAGDMVSLLAPNETVIDKVVYGDWNDGEPGNNAPVPDTGMSIVRIYGSEDSNSDYSDFGLSSTTTKGFLNVYVPVSIESEEEEDMIPVLVNTSTTSSTKPLIKKPEPLYPRITYPATALIGDEITLDASLSSGGEGKRQFIWEMDDGFILRGETIRHTYKASDTYSIVLTVFDDTGTEKHKTVKIKIVPNPNAAPVPAPEETKQAAVVSAKTSPDTKKPEPTPVFTQISELSKTKTNTLVRVRGVLASVFITKTTPEFYLVGEATAGGPAIGTLVKTKNNTIDARVGDIVEISGKYIVNTTSGNYVQYGSEDVLSIIGSGEVLVPVSSTIKTITQLSGGYVQVTGEVVEKKPSYSIVSDTTGEIKIVGELGEDIKIKDRIIVIGYVVRIKEGAVIRIIGSNDSVFKEKNISSATTETSEIIDNPKRPITTLILVGLVCVTGLGLGIKRTWLSKNKIVEATEI